MAVVASVLDPQRLLLAERPPESGDRGARVLVGQSGCQHDRRNMAPTTWVGPEQQMLLRESQSGVVPLHIRSPALPARRGDDRRYALPRIGLPGVEKDALRMREEVVMGPELASRPTPRGVGSAELCEPALAHHGDFTELETADRERAKGRCCRIGSFRRSGSR